MTRRPKLGPAGTRWTTFRESGEAKCPGCDEPFEMTAMPDGEPPDEDSILICVACGIPVKLNGEGGLRPLNEAEQEAMSPQARAYIAYVQEQLAAYHQRRVDEKKARGRGDDGAS